MVTDLRELLRESVSAPPPDTDDLGVVLAAGRRRVRRRRLLAGGAGLLAVAALALTPVAWQRGPTPDVASTGVPAPEGPVLRLDQAGQAVEGRDYRVLTTYTNEDLDSDNGQYLEGVTEDGLVLLRDATDNLDRRERWVLMAPATGAKQWLPDAPSDGNPVLPLELGTDRLLMVTTRLDSQGGEGALALLAYDRRSGSWSTLRWPGLPRADIFRVVLGPEGRLYVPVPATQGQPPEGGWPTSPDGDAEDADAEGDTYSLWSVGLDDPADVRDEQLSLGDVAFTDDAMVWTDRTNGDSGDVHVRDLATGEEISFDPRTGERCNLLDLSAAGDRVVMSQYCGTYEGGVRDDRVQVLSTSGELVTTIQGDSIQGTLASGGAPGLVSVESYARGSQGTYVYDLAEDRFLRVSDSLSRWGLGGSTPAGVLMWHTSVNGGHGATQVLAEWQD